MKDGLSGQCINSLLNQHRILDKIPTGNYIPLQIKKHTLVAISGSALHAALAEEAAKVIAP
jgi:hypothetical protein